MSEPASSPLPLGAFSISLSVQDLAVSREFYEKLGFKIIGGVAEQTWLILQNGDTTIGIFQGMFEGNMLTFNPGWNARQETLENFSDVREIQGALEEQAVELDSRADQSTTGPASIMLRDPDGNVILIDQHV